MGNEGNWIVEVIRLLVAIIGGVLGSSLKVWLSKTVIRISRRNTVVQQQAQCGNVSMSAETINFFGLQGKELNYAIAEESSEVIRSRTINRLDLKHKTILHMPKITMGQCSDAVLRIDTGDVVYPLGVCLDSDEFDARDRDWLNLKPNSRNYLSFTYVGECNSEGKTKHLWLASKADSLNLGDKDVSRKTTVSRKRFGKIDSSGQIKYAEDMLVDDDIAWGNPTEEMMMRCGYRIVENTRPDCREGFYLKMTGWNDDGQRLTPIFTEVPLSVQVGE